MRSTRSRHNMSIEMSVAGVAGLIGDPTCARACLDWTERRHHLAGPLGARLLLRLAELCWLRRESGSRAIRFTPAGYRELESRLGITLAPQE